MATIATPSTRYEALEEKRDLPRALMGGTAKMREEGKEFLPKHPAESEESYQVRLNSTTLYNGFADTVSKMVGKVFSKPVILDENVPGQIVAICDNIDGQGRNLTAFALDAFKDALIDGISFVLIDFPVVSVEGRAATMADQITQGAKPYTVLVCADNLIGWKSANVNGAQVLTEARIKETFTEPDQKDEWAEVKVEQIRLLRPGSFELWRKQQDGPNAGKWFLYGEGLTTLPYIPLIPVYTNRVGFYEGEPPLMPLAELNLEHWISSSEQRKSLTFARFAMLVLTGVDANSAVDVGPDKVLKLPQGATGGYIETSGAGIEAGRLDLEAIQERMTHAGLSIKVQSTVGVTATAAAIDSTDADSALMAAATALEDSLNQVLYAIAGYLGLPDGGTVQLNKSFAQKQPTGNVADLSTLYVSGLLSNGTVINELKRRGVVDEELDVEEELAKIGDSQPSLMDANNGAQ